MIQITVILWPPNSNLYCILKESPVSVSYAAVAREDILSGCRLLWFLNTLSECTHTTPVTSHQLLLVHSTPWFGNWPPRIQQTRQQLNVALHTVRRVGWFVTCENRIRDSLFPLCKSQLYRLAKSSVLVCCWMLLMRALQELFLQNQYRTFLRLVLFLSFFFFFKVVLRASLGLWGFLWYANISHLFRSVAEHARIMMKYLSWMFLHWECIKQWEPYGS